MKHIVFVGVNVGAVGLNVICFVGVVSILLCADCVRVVGVGVDGGGWALCLRVKRLRWNSFSLTIFCWRCRLGSGVAAGVVVVEVFAFVLVGGGVCSVGVVDGI